jgi:hypothetical protein
VNRHHLRFVLRQWIEHQNPANLRLHVLVNGAAWLGLTTVLSQVPAPVAVPLLGSSLGAWFVALSVLYWLPADPLTAVLVGLFTVGWAHQMPSHFIMTGISEHDRFARWCNAAGLRTQPRSASHHRITIFLDTRSEMSHGR